MPVFEADRRREAPRSVRALVLHRAQDATVAPVSLSQRAGHVRIKPVAVGLCGSDVHGYLGRTDRRAPGTVMGHEVCAVVCDPRSELDGCTVLVDPVLSCGSCRACLEGHPNRCDRRRLYGCTPELPGGFAEAMDVQAGNLVVVDGRADPLLLALTEPLAVGWHAAGRAPLEGREALVVGAGVIGLGTALAALRRGAASVTVAERSAARRRLAELLGLRAVAPDSVADGAYDVGFECVGHADTVQCTIAAVRSGGIVLGVGLAQRTWSLDAPELVMGERTVTGSAVYTPQEFRAVAQWLQGEGAARAAPMRGVPVGLAELPGVLAAHGTGNELPVRFTMVQEHP